MKLGIDFGSAYSTISRYDSDNGRAVALTLKEGDPASIPSSVAISKKGTVSCGLIARSKAGLVDLYEAFKMFLVESDSELLRRNGFDEDKTPEYISTLFLQYVLSGVVKKYADIGEDIEQIVICVPEVWRNNIRSIDGCNILRKILKQNIKLPDEREIKAVRVVTEPEAASAFFAHNYELTTKKAFNGHLLLIDYGGGTLDLTLMEISSDGTKTMEIGFRESGGIGENHPDENGKYIIGHAGFSYIRRVVELAILESGDSIDVDELDFESKQFKSAEHQLEDLLKDPSNMSEIEYNFGMFGRYEDFEEILDEDDIEFNEFTFMGEEITVTYQQLYRAYRDTIEKTLNDQLVEMNEKVRERIGIDTCSYESGTNDDFKIALVGGFCSFYLVRKQIESIYNFDTNTENDKRIKNINSDKSEQAIALGAGLIASGRVILQKTARYSIGLYTTDHEGRKHLKYGIRWHQMIEPEKPYYLLFSNDHGDTDSNRLKYAALKNHIENFVVEFSSNEKKGFRLKLKQNMIQRLANIPDGGLWCCGFSMDQNDVISFHVTPAPGSPAIYKGIKIALDSYSNMFEMTSGEEVYDDEI